MLFGWEVGRLEMWRAGNGSMGGSGQLTRTGKFLIGGVIVWSNHTLENGIIIIVPVPGLSSVATLAIG